MVNLKFTIFALGVAASSLDKQLYSWRDVCLDSSDPCISGFTWCYRGKCSFPGNVYAGPYSPDEGWAKAAVTTNYEYYVGWRNTSPNYPTLLEWQVDSNIINYSDRNRSVKHLPSFTWSRTFPKGAMGFDFSFDQLMRDFPTKQHPDLTELDVRALAQGSSRFIVSQPERPWTDVTGAEVDPAKNQSTSPWRGKSDVFSVFDYRAAEVMRALHDRAEADMYNKWKLPVALSVGLGVPALIAIAFFAGHFLEKRRSVHRHQPLPTTAEKEWPTEYKH